MIECCVTECACTFISADELIMHVKSIHKPPVNYKFKCTFPACIQIFSNLYGYTRHLKNHKIDSTSRLDASSSHEDHEGNLESYDVPMKMRKFEDDVRTPLDTIDATIESDLYNMKQSAVEYTPKSKLLPE